jgi:hypothetical protein
MSQIEKRVVHDETVQIAWDLSNRDIRRLKIHQYRTGQGNGADIPALVKRRMKLRVFWGKVVVSILVAAGIVVVSWVI